MAAETTPSAASESKASDERSFVIVDLGRKKKQQIRNLTKGRGRLMRDIADLTDELVASGEIAAGVQPLVVIVREKKAEKLGMWNL